MTVGQLLDTLSAAELAEWQAYYQLKAKEQESARKKAGRKGR